LFFCFNDTATTEIYTLSLHDALPIFAVVDVDHLLHRGVGIGNRSEEAEDARLQGQAGIETREPLLVGGADRTHGQRGAVAEDDRRLAMRWIDRRHGESLARPPAL